MSIGGSSRNPVGTKAVLLCLLNITLVNMYLNSQCSSGLLKRNDR